MDMRPHPNPVVNRLLSAPYGHTITRDKAGNSHVTIFRANGALLHTIVAPTFDEAVTRALDLADEVTGGAA
jgi:hypothetical protein